MSSRGGPVESQLLARIARLKKQHEEERAAVEVEIESHPLEPQFSAKIQTLLQQEEEAGRSGSRDRRDAVGHRVDVQMREECRAALRYIVDLHTKQRDKVYQTHIAQREALTRELLHEVSAVRSGGGASSSMLPSLGAGAGASGSPVALPAEDSFGPKEVAMRKQADRNWANGEKFNLMQAFQRQVDRIVVEWGGYLDAMAREYVTEVAKLEGTDPAPALAALEAAKAGGGAEGKQGKWLDKEKQEQLVHTAPVLSPSAKSPSFGGGGEGGGASGPDSGAGPSPAASSRPGARGTSVVPRAPGLSAAVKRQLHDLRQQFEAAKKEVVMQRDTAIRWVIRQRNRMFMQVDAVEAERQFRALHEAREESLFAALEKHVVTGLGR